MNANKLIVKGQFGKYGALGYRSAKLAAREGRSYNGGSGDIHMRYDRPQLIRQSRAFYRDNPLYKGMIDTAVDYIIGEGFQLQVQTGRNATNKKIEQLWKSWFARPEIKGLLGAGETSQMICREMLICGDTLVIKTDKGPLQLIEAEQIASSRAGSSADGIEKNIYMTPTAYWVSRYRSGYVNTQTAVRYEADKVIFLTCPDRPSSTRGVPAAQASFPMLHRINDICDSEAIAWQLLSRLAVSVNKKQAGQEGFNLSREDPNKTSSQAEGDLATRLTELDYALIFWGQDDDEIKGIDRNIPGKNFSESLRIFLRILGLPLGLPLELVLLDWTKSNYSQSRAVLEQAFKRFKKIQKKMADFFYTPVFEWKLGQWRKTEQLGNMKDIPYSWIKPTFPWIDQLKEAQARGEAVDRGFMTHSEVCKSRGLDSDEVISAREQEVIKAIEIAKRIEKKYEGSISVPWQIFAGLEAGAGKGGGKNSGQADGQDEKEDKKEEETENQ
jgi:lambda family phage portal protein